MKIPSLSFTCEDIGVAMVTNMISQLQKSFPLRRAVGSFEIKKKSCLLCRNFISIYKIKRTLHGRLGIRILSSSAESISHEWASLTWEMMNERYFQHSKIKFVSPSGHVISSISVCNNENLQCKRTKHTAKYDNWQSARFPPKLFC